MYQNLSQVTVRTVDRPTLGERRAGLQNILILHRHVGGYS